MMVWIKTKSQTANLSLRFPFFRIRLMSRFVRVCGLKYSVKDHMKSLGLSPSRDKHIYATMLSLSQISVPRSLRGYKRDSVSGFHWKREFEFKVRHLYGFLVRDLISTLKDLLDKGGDMYGTKINPVRFVAYVGHLLVEVHVDFDRKILLSCSPVNFCSGLFPL